MIYIKRILWLIGLIPVCLVIAIWFIIELSTMQLKILLHFILIINSYFLLNGEKYYNENVGAE